MLPNPQNYMIFPSVVPADQAVEMTIVAAERAFIPTADFQYAIKIIAVNGDESSNYYQPTPQASFAVGVLDGSVRFSYTFCEEQEYLIRLFRDEKMIAELHVYSLYEDLYALIPLRGDFHGHSYRSDGKRDPAALAGHYREQGYDFFALTDHNRFYPGREIEEAYKGVALGITRVSGEEIHTPPSPVHIVHVGGKNSVAFEYLKERESYEAQKATYLARVPEHIPQKYAARYAMAMWATDRIHANGGMAIFAHPYWLPSASQCHNVCDELARILLKSGMFDAYELVGGMSPLEISRSVALWADLRAEGVDIAVVGSSDVHGIHKSKTFPHYFTVCFATANENDAIMDAVRAKRSVAVQAHGDEYQRQYTTYGSLRYVSYANFLLKYYFPERTRTCAGEGVAMRAYAIGAVPPALVELTVQMNADDADRFFGRKPPLLPTREMIDSAARHRAYHIENGPITRGSGIDSAVVTRQL